MQVSRKALTVCACSACLAAPAMAGGIDRSPFTTDLLFEPGRYLRVELGGFQPEVSGALSSRFGPLAGTGSGDMSNGFGSWSIGAKFPISPRVDLAITLDQPYGASVAYPQDGSNYILAGSWAKLENGAVTAVMRYKLGAGFSALGGVRIEQMTGEADLKLNGSLGYHVDASRETDMGYILGVAWEKPEIAARIALSYISAIDHDFEATEISYLGVSETAWTTEIPQSVLLEAQTGIAPDTLLFGSIRWTDWSAFSVAPAQYRQTVFSTGTSNLVDPVEDTVTYTLGLGHRFNETWSGAVIAAYEPSSGNIVGNLGPTDGFRSLALAATWKRGDISATLGVRYVEIGDATTRIAEFEDNSGWGMGLRLGYRF